MARTAREVSRGAAPAPPRTRPRHPGHPAGGRPTRAPRRRRPAGRPADAQAGRARGPRAPRPRSGPASPKRWLSRAGGPRAAAPRGARRSGTRGARGPWRPETARAARNKRPRGRRGRGQASGPAFRRAPPIGAGPRRTLPRPPPRRACPCGSARGLRRIPRGFAQRPFRPLPISVAPHGRRTCPAAMSPLGGGRRRSL